MQVLYTAQATATGGRDGHAWHAAPEHDDVAARAAAAGVALHEVHAAALTAWRTR